MNNTELYALSLTIIAGLATSIGSLIALFTKRTSTKFLACSLAFSAGVMIYVSMVELFFKGLDYLTISKGIFEGKLFTTIWFFSGMALIALIDYILPSTDGDIGGLTDEEKLLSLKKISLVTMIAMAIHNFPEGLVTFTSTLKDIELGALICVAIAIHNIPEGISTTLPVYIATGNKRKAFLMSFLSGSTEPLGAIVGYTIIRPYINDCFMGTLFASASGIMMFIALEELLPMAREYEKSKAIILSVIGGMLVMAVSMLFFG